MSLCLKNTRIPVAGSALTNTPARTQFSEAGHAWSVGQKRCLLCPLSSTQGDLGKYLSNRPSSEGLSPQTPSNTDVVVLRDDTYCFPLACPVPALTAVGRAHSHAACRKPRAHGRPHLPGREAQPRGKLVQRVRPLGLQLGGSPGRPAVKPVLSSSAPLPPRASRRQSACED